MYKKEYQSQKSFRFRRWSRKSYSVFCSLGKCITIGKLHKEAIEASLKKKPGHHHIPLIAEQAVYGGEYPDADFRIPGTDALTAENMPEMFLLSLPQRAKETSSCNRNDHHIRPGNLHVRVCCPAFLYLNGNIYRHAE